MGELLLVLIGCVIFHVVRVEFSKQVDKKNSQS